MEKYDLIIVGAGPAGIFTAVELLRRGSKKHILLVEKGKPVEKRHCPKAEIGHCVNCRPTCAITTGFSGAGAFSDGKLNTGTKDVRHRFILEELAACGAPRDILVDAKPHVGTDYLHIALRNLRRQLIALGTDVRFQHRLTDIRIENGAVAAVTVEGPQGTEILACRHLILAPGHSARDTFEMLLARAVPMEPKAFAVGVRIEQRQRDIDAAQYKEYAGTPGLPASTYKLSCHLPDGRAAFSFCVCPGGEVVAAASEPGRLVTNGMSGRARDGENSNGGLLVGVAPADFGSPHPLAGMEFQAVWEERAFALGGGGFYAPAACVGSFLAGTAPALSPSVNPTYRPGVVPADLSRCLPGFVTDTLRGALPLLGKKLRGFDAPSALLTGVETRSSSPVRILRGEDLQSPLRGLYPCGEGGGWAGGIVSAAVDGIRVAEQIAAGSRLPPDPLTSPPHSG